MSPSGLTILIEWDFGVKVLNFMTNRPDLGRNTEPHSDQRFLHRYIHMYDIELKIIIILNINKHTCTTLTLEMI